MELDIKEEPVDSLLPEREGEGGAVKPEGVSVSIQTESPPSPSPPPFYTEWEEGVRRSVWQPGYLPQPEPPGTIQNLHSYQTLLVSEI